MMGRWVKLNAGQSWRPTRANSRCMKTFAKHVACYNQFMKRKRKKKKLKHWVVVYVFIGRTIKRNYTS